MMQPATQTLNNHLQEATRVYGCMTEFSDLILLKQLNNIPCTLIVHEKNWDVEPNKTVYNLYLQLKPVLFDYYTKFNPYLKRKQEEYPSKAVRSISPTIFHKFLIIEKDNQTSLWIGSTDEGIYNCDSAVIEDFRNEFFKLLCYSGELKDGKIEAFKYYHFVNQEMDSWQLLEEKNLGETNPMLSRAQVFLSSPNVQLAGRVLYFGVTLAIETKFPHVAIVRKIIEKWI